MLVNSSLRSPVDGASGYPDPSSSTADTAHRLNDVDSHRSRLNGHNGNNAFAAGLSRPSADTSRMADNSLMLRISAVDCLTRLINHVDFEELTGQIVHSTCRLLLMLDTYQVQLLSAPHAQHNAILSSLGVTGGGSSSTKSFSALVSQACTTALNMLSPCVVELLTALLIRMGRKFNAFLPLVQKMLSRLHLSAQNFRDTLDRVSHSLVPLGGFQQACFS